MNTKFITQVKNTFGTIAVWFHDKSSINELRMSLINLHYASSSKRQGGIVLSEAFEIVKKAQECQTGRKGIYAFRAAMLYLFEECYVTDHKAEPLLTEILSDPNIKRVFAWNLVFPKSSFPNFVYPSPNSTINCAEAVAAIMMGQMNSEGSEAIQTLMAVRDFTIKSIQDIEEDLITTATLNKNTQAVREWLLQVLRFFEKDFPREKRQIESIRGYAGTLAKIEPGRKAPTIVKLRSTLQLFSDRNRFSEFVKDRNPELPTWIPPQQ